MSFIPPQNRFDDFKIALTIGNPLINLNSKVTLDLLNLGIFQKIDMRAEGLPDVMVHDLMGKLGLKVIPT